MAKEINTIGVLTSGGDAPGTQRFVPLFVRLSQRERKLKESREDTQVC